MYILYSTRWELSGKLLHQWSLLDKNLASISRFPEQIVTSAPVSIKLCVDKSKQVYTKCYLTLNSGVEDLLA